MFEAERVEYGGVRWITVEVGTAVWSEALFVRRLTSLPGPSSPD